MLDPFGGSGVTAVEALILDRQGIHIDISPLSKFLADVTAMSPVKLPRLEEGFNRVEKQCKNRINEWFQKTTDEIARIKVPYWYPDNVALPENADVDYVHQLFTPRQLISLSLLRHSIMQEQDEDIRDLLLLVFSATLIKTNKTFVSAKGRAPSRGGAAIFSMYRYYVPKNPVELNVWEQFALRFKGTMRAKKETNHMIGEKFNAVNFRAIRGSATQIEKYLHKDSVDYIFTDPPYGAHIAYLDLSIMFHAWLQLDITDEIKALEIIEGGDLQKSKDDYFDLMDKSFEQMFQVLKYDRWMSLVFAHKDTAYWNAIVRGAERAGFEYVNTVPQNPQTIWSMHKKKNPLTVLAGNLILNFKKTRNPRTIAITNVGADAVQVMKNTAELIIVRNNGSATTDQIVNEIIIKLLENGLLTEVKTKVGDIAPLLQEYFVFHEIDESWHLPPNTTLGDFIPLDERIKFYLIDIFNRADRQGDTLTFDDLIHHILPQLINGETPDNETTSNYLEQIAYSPDGIHWKLKDLTQGLASQRALLTTEKNKVLPNVLAPVTANEVTHNSIIYRLAKLGKAGGFDVWIGKQEQRASFNGEKLADLSIETIPFPDTIDEYTKKAVEQIDVIWLDRLGNLKYGFEVEHTTTIKSGIQRFVEVLKVDPKIAGNLILFIPKKRIKKITKELTKSAFVGHPMYMENKIRFGIYPDFLKMYDSLSHTSFNREDITKQLDMIVKRVDH